MVTLYSHLETVTSLHYSTTLLSFPFFFKNTTSFTYGRSINCCWIQDGRRRLIFSEKSRVSKRQWTSIERMIQHTHKRNHRLESTGTAERIEEVSHRRSNLRLRAWSNLHIYWGLTIRAPVTSTTNDATVGEDGWASTVATWCTVFWNWRDCSDYQSEGNRSEIYVRWLAYCQFLDDTLDTKKRCAFPIQHGMISLEKKNRLECGWDCEQMTACIKWSESTSVRIESCIIELGELFCDGVMIHSLRCPSREEKNEGGIYIYIYIYRV